MTRDQLLRFVLWVGITISANATRKKSRVPSTWMAHFFGNTFLLALPELYRAASSALRLDEWASGTALAPAHQLARELVVDNPRYTRYIAPIAGAIIAAHPRINIYRGEWAQRQVFGLGLDSIPHALTALTLTHTVFDALSSPALMDRIPNVRRHSVLVSAIVLTVATVLYESGEFAIHLQELRVIKDDPSLMAMDWSVKDMLQDVFSNVVGWSIAVMQRT